MPINVTAIFDIGKTNKKFFLFDEQMNEVYQQYIKFTEVQDDDGFDCDDLAAIEKWMMDTYNNIINDERFVLTAINFSAYGATIVYLNEALKPFTPLYNYTKPYPAYLLELFKKKHGNLETWSQQTASPVLGMLNAGLQIFWLKYEKPNLYAQVRHAIFLPQYFSFLFSRKLLSDYTSIGCHTGMWEFGKAEFHKWMYDEEIVQLLPPFPYKDAVNSVMENGIRVGAGIHDSSAALFSYKKNEEEPFILLSTGTWVINLNPFNQSTLTNDELQQDSLCYLQPDGTPVKASRLFMGAEFNNWIKILSIYFKVDVNYHTKVSFNKRMFDTAEKILSPLFNWQNIKHPNNKITLFAKLDLSWFHSFEEAYHHLVKELVELLIEKIWLIINTKNMRKIFIDGGFAGNHVFIDTLAEKLPDFEIIPSEMPLGSAIGAAMVINETNILRNKCLIK